jgi:hypothetical protein
VTEAVVDRLEVVKVEIHDCEPTTVPAPPCERLLDAIVEERPVRQASQRVVESPVAEGDLSLRRLLVPPHDSGHPRDDQHREGDRGGGDHNVIEPVGED